MAKTIGFVKLLENAEALVSIEDEGKVYLSVYSIADTGTAVSMDVAQAKILVALLQGAIEKIEKK